MNINFKKHVNMYLSGVITSNTVAHFVIDNINISDIENDMQGIPPEVVEEIRSIVTSFQGGRIISINTTPPPANNITAIRIWLDRKTKASANLAVDEDQPVSQPPNNPSGDKMT